ncbi:hypothetical protein C8J57DRAFT_15629 [Mycena rebaudengoi]|nr:hypothetical protein C8J57DRAFT_15629 [Mycena rebaudengoi]
MWTSTQPASLHSSLSLASGFENGSHIYLRLIHHIFRQEPKRRERSLFWAMIMTTEDEANDFDIQKARNLWAEFPRLLSRTVFVCDACTPPLWNSIGIDPLYFERESAGPLYCPEVLAHDCLVRNMSSRDRTESTDSLKHLIHYDRDRGIWNCRILIIEKSLGTIFESIITIAGKDPLHTGARDMDRIEIWFVCMHPTCLTLLQGCNYCAQAFKWRDAVKHHAECHPEHPVDFETMTSSQADFCKSRLRPLTVIAVPLNDWLCAHCRDLPMKRPSVLLEAIGEHLKSE